MSFIVKKLDNQFLLGGSVMEELKNKLYESIEKYGSTDPATVALSQQLDEYVVKEQKEFYGIN